MTALGSRARWVAVLVAGVLLLALVPALALRTLGADTIEVTAYFDDSAGLFEGDDVGVLGVPVGQVSSIEPQGPRVAVTMEVERSAGVPASAGAVVVVRSLATNRYVELTPATGEGPPLSDGDEIPLARTRTPVEFDELVGSLEEFSSGLVGPDGEAEGMRQLLDAGASALDGRGQGIRRALRQTARAADALSQHRGDIGGAVKDLDTLTSTLARNRRTIDRFITSVNDVTDLFAEERQSFGRTLRHLNRALADLAQFLRENREDLTGSLREVTRLGNELLENRDRLAEAVQVLPLTARNVGDAVGPDDRIDTRLPPQYLSPAQGLTEQLCAQAQAICDQLGTDPDLGELLGSRREEAP